MSLTLRRRTPAPAPVIPLPHQTSWVPDPNYVPAPLRATPTGEDLPYHLRPTTGVWALDDVTHEDARVLRTEDAEQKVWWA